MGGPGSGKFIIKLASDPQPPAGVDLAGDARVPVITDGSDNVVCPSVFILRQLRS